MKGRHIAIALLISLHVLALGMAYADDAQKKPWFQNWREATVALGVVSSEDVILPDGTRKTGDHFKVIGTGVIFSLPGDRTKTPWLVTAKHVFDDPQQSWHPDVLRVRFAWFEDKSAHDYIGIPIQLRSKGQPLWIKHPDDKIDLVAIPLKIAKAEAGRDEVPAVTRASFPSEADVCETAPIMVLGYPGLVGPAFWPRALVREGIIAWCDPKNPMSEVLLIDAVILGGNSGGPVFMRSGFDCYGTLNIGGKSSFLGIISQGAGGLGLVVPAIKVKELLEHIATFKIK